MSMMAPDFVRHDRGPDDEHWMRAFGALCVKCGALMEEADFARRCGWSGGWRHERCPARIRPDDERVRLASRPS